jgi:release factor glutamine methyltransferase
MSNPGAHVRYRTTDLLQKATALLEEKGVISPRLNAETLLAEATGMSRVELYTNFEKPLSDAETERFRGLIRRRLAHEPLQYITGCRDFRHLSLAVDPAVLIPRPETELLVDRALQKMKENPSCRVVLDLGTGAGCIALAMAQENPRAEVHAADISAAAIEVAERNAAGNDLEEMRGAIHLILSNPPYVSTRDYGELPPEVKDHEPRLALLADEEGTCFHYRILKEAVDWLAPGGWVILEGGASQMGPVRERALETGYECVEILYDYNGLARFVEACLIR